MVPQSPETARVAVSIVSYGTADMVLAALPALTAELSSCAAGAVAIVDNASPGGDGDRLAAGLAAGGFGPEVRLIRSPVNGGFAAGNNLAFAAFRDLEWTPDAVLLLNPDAEIRPGALRAMLAVMAAHPRAGVVGARLENADGTEWAGAFRFPSAMSEFAGATGLGALIRRWPKLAPETAAPARVDWVTGAAMLVRREALEALGGMDEGYFLYYEEVDFMRRAAEAGWETWHAPAARVRHAAGAATGIDGGGGGGEGRMPDYWFRSWRRYFARNHGPAYARAAAAARLAGMAVGLAQRRLRGRAYEAPAGFWGDFLRKGLLGGMRPPPEGRGP